MVVSFCSRVQWSLRPSCPNRLLASPPHPRRRVDNGFAALSFGPDCQLLYMHHLCQPAAEGRSPRPHYQKPAPPPSPAQRCLGRRRRRPALSTAESCPQRSPRCRPGFAACPHSSWAMKALQGSHWQPVCRQRRTATGRPTTLTCPGGWSGPSRAGQPLFGCRGPARNRKVRQAKRRGRRVSR